METKIIKGNVAKSFSEKMNNPDRTIMAKKNSYIRNARKNIRVGTGSSSGSVTLQRKKVSQG